MKLQNILKIFICLWFVGFGGMVPVYGAADYKTCERLCTTCPTDGDSCTNAPCDLCLKECPAWKGHCNPIPLNQTLCSQACGSQSSYAGCSSCFGSNSSCQAQNITMTNIPSSGFSGCSSIATQFNSCQAVCDAKNCSECLAPACTALGAPFTSNPGYMACSNCKKACESSNCTDCATSTCEALGSFITSIPTYTACSQCITACNAKNCSECLAPACTALGSSITSNPGYVACAACTSACAGASDASCPSCFNTCQSNGITSSITGAPSSLASCTAYNTALNSCAGVCEGTPISSTVSTDPSWEKCPQCMSACQAQNIPLPASNACPQSLQACNMGCDAAVNDMTGQQCGTCLSSFACQLGGIKVTPGSGSTQASFNFSSINNGSSYASINKCNTIFNNITNCYNAIVAASNNASQCNGVITNNSNCKALGITFNNLSGFSWLSTCSTAIANANAAAAAAAQAACTSACSNAPSSPQVSPNSTAWSQCSNCVNKCNAAGVTGSNAPGAYSVCTSANATTACVSGCAGASNDVSGQTCNSCLSNPACAFAGISSGNISTGSSGGLGDCATLYADINTCTQSCATASGYVTQSINQADNSPQDVCINNNLCLANTACQKLGLTQNNIVTFLGYGGSWNNLSTCANMQSCVNNCSRAYTQSAAVCESTCFGSSACQQVGISSSSAVSAPSNGSVFAACANLINQTQTMCQQQCSGAGNGNVNSTTCGYCLSNSCSSSGISGTSGYQTCFNWWNNCGSGAGVSLGNPNTQAQSQVNQILNICASPSASGSGSPLATCVKACNSLFSNYPALYENAVTCVNNCANVPSSLVGNYSTAQQIVQALQGLEDGSINQNFYGPCNAAYNTLRGLIGGQDPISVGAMPAACTNRTTVPSACPGACAALNTTQMVTGAPLAPQDIYVITTCGQSFCGGMVGNIPAAGINISWSSIFPGLVYCLQEPGSCPSCCQALSTLRQYNLNPSPTFSNFCSRSTCQQMGY